MRIETRAPIYQRIRHCVFYLSNPQNLFHYSQLLTEIPELTSALYYRLGLWHARAIKSDEITDLFKYFQITAWCFLQEVNNAANYLLPVLIAEPRANRSSFKTPVQRGPSLQLSTLTVLIRWQHVCAITQVPHHLVIQLTVSKINVILFYVIIARSVL